MKKLTTLVLLTLIVALVGASTGLAAIKTSAVTGNWSTAGTWSPSGVPAAGDDVVIANGHTVTIIINVTANPGTITINSGGQLAVRGFNLTVTGATTVNGTLAFTTGTGGARIFTGPVTVNSGGVWNNSINQAITFRGGLTCNGATFTAGSGVYTFDANPQAMGGTLSIPSVTVTAITLTNNGTLTVGTALSGTGGLTQGANSALNIGGTSGITTLTATASPNTVNYTGAAQTVKAVAYDNLALSGSGVKTLTGLTTINGDLTMSGTATASTAANLTVGGVLSVGGGTSLTAANNLIVTGAATVGGTLTVSGSNTFSSSVTLSSGVCSISTARPP